MDFKDWKKIKEDGKSCTLQHPKGHVMTIAIKALPKAHREALKGLEFARGGRVDQMISPNDSLASGKGGTSTQGSDVRQAKYSRSLGMKEGPKITDELAKKEARGRAEMERHNKPKLKGLKDGGDPADAPDMPSHSDSSTQDDSSDPQQMAPTNHAPITIINNPPPAQAATQAPSPAPTPAPMRKDGLVETGVKIPEPVTGRPDLRPNGNVDPTANQENYQEAIKGERDVKVAEGEANKKREASFLNEQEKMNNEFVQNQQTIMDHVNDAAQAVKDGAINPKHYMESLGTGGKVLTALGVMFGGVAGGQNFALDYVNRQIDRDIKSQETDLDRRKTVLGAYQQLFGPTLAAYNATKVTLNDAYVHQGHLIAAQLNTPTAWANWLKFRTEKSNENARLIRDSAMDMTAHPGYKGGGGASSQGEQGGASAPTGEPGAKNEAPKWNEDFLLGPGAASMYHRAQYSPKTKAAYDNGALQRQWTQAQQADKSLGRIREVFAKLSENTGGLSGRIHRNFNPHSLAAVGGAGGAALGVLGSIPLTGGLAAGPAAALGAGEGAAIGEGTGQIVSGMTNNTQNRSYDAAQSAITGMISSALKGTNIGSGDIDAIVRKNSPESGDAEKDKQDKLNNIMEFIRQHTETNLLEDAGMLNRKGRKK